MLMQYHMVYKYSNSCTSFWLLDTLKLFLYIQSIIQKWGQILYITISTKKIYFGCFIFMYFFLLNCIHYLLNLFFFHIILEAYIIY